MKKERIFWGIFFIAGAVALLVSKIGLLGDLNVWTILLTVLLAAGLVKSGVKRSISGVLFSLAFLAIIYARPLGITAITPWPVLGAAMLGSIGFSLLFHPRKYYKRTHYHDEHFGESEMVDGEQINLDTLFSSAIKYIRSDDFKKAYIDCSFGAMKVYFDNAIILQEQAEIILDVSFAGVELYIPKAWNVETRANVSFAGLEEKNKNETSGVPKVIISGDVSFSGITIIYI